MKIVVELQNEHFNFIWQLILLLQTPESKQYKELVQSRRCILRGSLSVSLSLAQPASFSVLVLIEMEVVGMR